MFFVDRETDDAGPAPPKPERHEFHSYGEAIACLRARIAKPDETGTFTIVEDGVTVLRVWRDTATGRWFDSGRYA